LVIPDIAKASARMQQVARQFMRTHEGLFSEITRRCGIQTTEVATIWLDLNDLQPGVAAFREGYKMADEMQRLGKLMASSPRSGAELAIGSELQDGAKALSGAGQITHWPMRYALGVVGELT